MRPKWLEKRVFELNFATIKGSASSSCYCTRMKIIFFKPFRKKKKREKNCETCCRSEDQLPALPAAGGADGSHLDLGGGGGRPRPRARLVRLPRPQHPPGEVEITRTSRGKGLKCYSSEQTDHSYDFVGNYTVTKKVSDRTVCDIQSSLCCGVRRPLYWTEM